MKLAFQNLENERRDEEPVATGMGIVSRDGKASRSKGCVHMARFATKRRGTELVGAQNRSQKIFFPQQTEDDLAEEFSAVLLPFTARVLKKMTGVSLDTAKSWKKGVRFPHGASLMRLGAGIQDVNEWVNAKMDRGESLEFESDQNVTEGIERLQRTAKKAGPEGEAARSLLRQIIKGRPR